MTAVDVGPFRLINPPEGQERIIQAAVAAIDYPWERLGTTLAGDKDGAVLVTWEDTGQGVSGQFFGGSYEIHLSGLERDLGAQSAFVFAHEVGHLIDQATIDDQARAAILALFHDGGFVQLGHFNHDHPDADHHLEAWWNGSDAYVSRIYECYADQFVAAFAPAIWDGTLLPNSGQRGVRFVHWTDDLDAIRRLTLTAPAPTPAPTPLQPRKVTMSRGAPIDHALADLALWRKQHPKSKFAWAKVLLAQQALRSIKRRPQ